MKLYDTSRCFLISSFYSTPAFEFGSVMPRNTNPQRRSCCYSVKLSSTRVSVCAEVRNSVFPISPSSPRAHPICG